MGAAMIMVISTPSLVGGRRAKSGRLSMIGYAPISRLIRLWIGGGDGQRQALIGPLNILPVFSGWALCSVVGFERSEIE